MIWRNKGWSGLIVSHSADKNTENWKINVRSTKWVSKYSSDLVGLEKYHNIPFSTTGFYTGGGGYKVGHKTSTWPYNHPVAELEKRVTL